MSIEEMLKDIIERLQRIENELGHVPDIGNHRFFNRVPSNQDQEKWKYQYGQNYLDPKSK